MRCTVSSICLLVLAAAPAVTSAQSPCPNGDCSPGSASGAGSYYAEAPAGDCYDGDCYAGGGGGGGLIARLRARCQSGECVPHLYGDPDLFYNFWAGPNCGGVAAQLYIAPHPVPSDVGHTFYTYQPLMPHEMLYPHRRTYHRYYDGGRGMNRTKVSWSKSPMYMASNVMGYFQWPR